MATIDPRFICVSDLELYMVDNASGLPLSGGIITFYTDSSYLYKEIIICSNALAYPSNVDDSQEACLNPYCENHWRKKSVEIRSIFSS